MTGRMPNASLDVGECSGRVLHLDNCRDSIAFNASWRKVRVPRFGKVKPKKPNKLEKIQYLFRSVGYTTLLGIMCNSAKSDPALYMFKCDADESEELSSSELRFQTDRISLTLFHLVITSTDWLENLAA